MVSALVDAVAGISLVPFGGITFGNPGPFVGDWSGAVSFPGSGGSRLEGPNVYPLSGTTAWTIECWIKPGTMPGGVWPILASKEYFDGGGRQGYSVTMNDTNGAGTGGFTLGCERWLNGAVDKVTGTTDFQSAAVWRHAAIIYTGSNLLAYVNAVLETTVASTKSLLANTQFFTVGDTPGGFNRPYPGLMAGLAIWSGVALTAADLLRHVNAGKRSPFDLINSGAVIQGVQAGRWL